MLDLERLADTGVAASAKLGRTTGRPPEAGRFRAGFAPTGFELPRDRRGHRRRVGFGHQWQSELRAADDHGRRIDPPGFARALSFRAVAAGVVPMTAATCSQVANRALSVKSVRTASITALLPGVCGLSVGRRVGGLVSRLRAAGATLRRNFGVGRGSQLRDDGRGGW